MDKRKWLVLVGGLIVIAVGGVVLMYQASEVSQKPDGTDASEGSGVVEEVDIIDTSTWTKLAGDGITLSYPAELGLSYIATQDWPPQGHLLAATGPMPCGKADTGTGEGGKLVYRVIGGRTYCVAQQSVTEARFVNTKYVYVFEKDGKVLGLSFALRFLNCVNYPADKKALCEAERQSFKLDPIVDRIAQTFVLSKIEPTPTNLKPPAGS
jgi:hypothetical protein